ncbi:MAG: hypothetical protein PHE68_01945 [Candidatus Peribacteraceae bacterium]|nr:hypothetical protein [Candidatus Peribacteraceae bacterium]MDD5075367.1 hypothetical protein [Candidatus Peribacteraceae bacterium]
MRIVLSPLPLLLIFLPGFALAADPVTTDLTPEQVQQQEWDTECRASLPFGQGDLEAALLTKLRQCINMKQHAQKIADDNMQELKRLSNRSDREAARRLNAQKRIRGGFQRLLDQKMQRRSGQGEKNSRTIQSIESVRRSLRKANPPNSTAN